MHFPKIKLKQPVKSIAGLWQPSRLPFFRDAIKNVRVIAAQTRALPTVFSALTTILFFLAAPADAGCYIEGASERLGNYCALDKIKGKKIDFRTAQLIDYKLKLEGKKNGLGFQSHVKPKSFYKTIFPILSYSNNINGGNPTKPLVLGELTFNGEKALFRKQGFLTGLGLRFNGRYIYDEGRYITYNAMVSHSHAIEHGIGVTTMAANACSVNHVKNWWYLDFCLNTFRVRKKLTDEFNNNVSISSSKVFESGNGVYSEMSFGINRTFTNNYIQNQLTVGYETIHSNGMFSDIHIKIGERTSNKLRTRFAFTGRVSTKIANKPLTIMTSYSKADGEVLLGVKRKDNAYSVQLAYPIWGNLSATVGYAITESTIDYFDERSPIFGMKFAQITF